jgi:hypothetical protein
MCYNNNKQTNKQTNNSLFVNKNCSMKFYFLTFIIFFDITKKMSIFGMYGQCEDLCHCAISILYQDLMKNSSKITN